MNIFEIKKLISAYLRKSGWIDSTKNTYRKALKYFVGWIEDNNITFIQKETLKEYLKYLKMNNVQNTISAYWNRVLDLFEFGENEFGYPDIINELGRIPNIKSKKELEITPEKVAKIYHEMPAGRNKTIAKYLVNGRMQKQIIDDPNIRSESTRNKGEPITTATVRKIVRNTFGCSPSDLKEVGKLMIMEIPR